MSRLKVVLAQDRTGLDEATLTKIRKEIQDVISKYVEQSLAAVVARVDALEAKLAAAGMAAD